MPVVTGKYGPLVGAIDEGTSSARFLVSNKFQTVSQKKLYCEKSDMFTTSKEFNCFVSFSVFIIIFG
jgi:glycerol kinase